MRLVSSTRAAGLAALILTTAVARPAGADERGESTATLLAIGGTLAPVLVGRGLAALPDDTPSAVYKAGVGLVVAGALVGPSAGHWYAGELGTTGLAVRGAGLGALVLGMAAMPCLTDECHEEGGGDHDGRLVAALALLAVGAGAVITGAILDVADADDAARRHDEAHLGDAPRTHMLTLGGSF